MIAWFFVLFSVSFSLELPHQMTDVDQVRALEIIGLGSTTKILSQSYPLGGHHGLELSLAFEAIDTGEIANLGAGAPKTNQVFYPTISIAKGIYNNSDIFFHFVPPNKTSGISKYGLSYRWSFYQALFLPLNFSLIGHANSSNLRNQLVTRNLGADLMVGLSVSKTSFFLAGGWANSSGRFTGGTSGVTLSGNTESHKVRSSHFMLGATYNFDPIFVGLSLDRFKEEVISFKVGLLF